MSVATNQEDSRGLAEIDVAILAGGLGTRLHGTLGDTPKILAQIDGRPFLDHLLEWLTTHGATRIVFCLGHLADRVIAYLDGLPSSSVQIATVVEKHPLGTAGALRAAHSEFTSESLMIINGDSWMDADLGAFCDDHRERQSYLSILCVRVADVSRYGRVELSENGAISRFVEKDPADNGSGWINGGIYLFSKVALSDLNEAKGPSLERDFFALQPPGRIRAYLAETAHFVDIGTPESLNAAAGILRAGQEQK